MSNITEEDVRKISQLARLDLSADECQKFGGQLARILDYIDQLTEVEIAGVDPFLPPTANESSFRADTITPSPSRDRALQNAPVSDGEFFQVPAVLK